MSDIKYKLPGSGVITLSEQTVNKLLRSGDSDAALLYLYILKTEGKSTAEETMSALGKGLGWINSAMATLSRIGLIQLEANEDDRTGGSDGTLDIAFDEPDETKHLSTEDMRRELEAGTDFSIVVEETQKSLGRLLSPDELTRLFGIYDLNMPPEVIIQLVTFCKGESKRTGRDRTLTVKYIEKAAFTWAREGIMTLDRAEEFIKNLEARRSVLGEIKAVMQIWDREFSATERKYVDNWIAMGFDVGAIEEAYERTVLKTGKLVWNYMDSIMQSWHNRGLHTAQEIMEKDPGASRAKKLSNQSRRQEQGVPNKDEIDYMQRVLDKTRNES